jgi:hypothetical protein
MVKRNTRDASFAIPYCRLAVTLYQFRIFEIKALGYNQEAMKKDSDEF